MIDDKDDVVWTDIRGRQYRLSEITDPHLKNIVAFLERRATAAEGHSFMGEEASYAAECVAESYRARAEVLRGEMAVRGLL